MFFSHEYGTDKNRTGLIEITGRKLFILPLLNAVMVILTRKGRRGGAAPPRRPRPAPNAVKFFSAVELMALLADREWLDDATKTIGQFWKRKNARRNGLTTEKQSDVAIMIR